MKALGLELEKVINDNTTFFVVLDKKDNVQSMHSHPDSAYINATSKNKENPDNEYTIEWVKIKKNG